SLISAPFTYIYLKFVDSGMIDRALEKSQNDMIERGMDEAAIEQAMEISAPFMTAGSFAVVALIIGIIGYVIIGLVVSIFTQKRNPEMSI
ncbi:MAG: DUF4199 family protein, partial [Cyclobacteriaceae bacterium]